MHDTFTRNINTEPNPKLDALDCKKGVLEKSKSIVGHYYKIKCADAFGRCSSPVQIPVPREIQRRST